MKEKDVANGFGSTRKRRSRTTDVLPHTPALVMAQLSNTSVSFMDLDGVRPTLVIGTGSVELHICVPSGQVTLADVAVVDHLMDAVAAWRVALIAEL